jgi:predicted CXXCH cytochrome family protein
VQIIASGRIAMKIPVLFSGISVLVMLLVSSPATAGMVEHHGQSVEAEGTAKDCLFCHDGSQAKHVSVCTVKCDFRAPHSILRPYPPKGKESKYAPVAVLIAKGVRIEEGKVTCISCHNLNNPAPGHLVRDEQGRMCTICHITMKGAH